MPDTAANLRLACPGLLPEPGIQRFQLVDPDPIPSRAGARAGRAAQRDATRHGKGRCAKGHSGNPTGRPRGIRNPRRRPLGLLLREARPGTLAPLVRRKRYLLRPVLSLVLPPARRPDPGERLGIDFARMRSAAEIAAAIGKALTAVSRGEITPSEGLRLARRARKPLRALRRKLWRGIARLEALRRNDYAERAEGRLGTSPARGGGGPQSGPEGADMGPDAPSTMRRMVPLPRCAGEEPN